MGIFGVIIIFIYFIVKLSSLDSFGIPYLTPFAPLNKIELKNSIIKFPTKKLDKRNNLLSNNTTKLKSKGETSWKKY